MSSFIKKAIFLIKNERYEEAEKLLISKAKDFKAKKALSYLYRKQHLYDKEKEIVEAAFKKRQADSYFVKRKKWLDLPLFEKVVPRKHIDFSRDPATIPSQEILEQTCFVTGGDSNVFEQVIELIESIKATKTYHALPIFILDVGFSQTQKNHFMNFESVTVIETNEIYEKLFISGEYQFKDALDLRNSGKFKMLLFMHFIDLVIKNYRFLFWLESDTWIQNEEGLDKFLFNAINQGVSFSEHVFRKNNDSIEQLKPFLKEKDILFSKKALAAGVLFIKGFLRVVNFQN